eukprot:CAMPEP_0204307874 /NCGR_PEP_ID=MMETSP0469-20131031/174_1 /ASSEMBLY_ACC=CAM_ASM_000384 /TAXON_ID=2969 /ORGANISM="Oxyrrhis marina" /LENGTH=699 /DNA_ID=CAMNT_0051287273 /DNA_START=274 /DNA_END=2373 /DNA_ORIENTATION=-
MIYSLPFVLLLLVSVHVPVVSSQETISCTSSAKDTTESSSIIAVQCTEEYEVYLKYGEVENDLDQDTNSNLVSAPKYKRKFALKDLPSGTQYFYKVVEFNTGNEGDEGIKSFTTLGTAVTEPPTSPPEQPQTTNQLSTFIPKTNPPTLVPTTAPTEPDACVGTVTKAGTFKATISVLCDMNTKGKVRYGFSDSSLQQISDTLQFEVGVPYLAELSDLEPSTTYFFAVVYKGQFSPVDSFTTEKENATYWMPCNGQPPAVVLAQPTDQSVVAIVRPVYNVYDVAFEFGTSPGALLQSTAAQALAGNVSEKILINGLCPSTRYFYRMTFSYDTANCTAVQSTEAFFFSTAAAKGQAFSFVVTSDTHWGDSWEPSTFETTLESILLEAGAGEAQFMLELGDTFMGEKLDLSAESIHKPYQDLFDHYYSTVCHSLPLYLVTGNHEGENGWELEGEDSRPVFTARARKLYYANPEPDEFYSGNEDVPFESLGLLGDYYSWEWGDALFVALDPFWYTVDKPGSNACTDNPGWCFTLGKQQYTWLYEVLARSSATFKYVFLHNLVGGTFGNETDRAYTGAGDASWAQYFEWGGYDEDGTYRFDEMRPGWSNLSIHEILVETGVQVVFRGHDHFWSQTELDGVVYQGVPRPSFGKSADVFTASLKGYDPADVLEDGGYLSVSVNATCTGVGFRGVDGGLLNEYFICI